MSTVAAGQPKRRTFKFNFRGVDLDSVLDICLPMSSSSSAMLTLEEGSREV
ncbi:Ribosomal protein S19 family protein [Perilla frutescens var. frutescens]|nr:Ribosomal protein S19 family protein [Perilla frutescens var. frutescens]